MKILVLGASGMLGAMVYHYLCNNTSYEIYGSYNSNKLGDMKNDRTLQVSLVNMKNIIDSADEIASLEFDYVINCIGIIKQRLSDFSQHLFEQTSFLVNSVFPFQLSAQCNEISPHTRIIQIATDCIYDGQRGWYSEDDEINCYDVYARTKRFGEINTSNYLNIRCSIIGPELIKHDSLMDWYLFNKNAAVNGFVDHLWNGVTTLQFSRLIERIITNTEFDELHNLNPVIHFVINQPVSKYEILRMLKMSFQSSVQVNPICSSTPINRTLKSRYLQNEQNEMQIAINDLAEYTSQNSDFFKAHKLLGSKIE